MNLKVSLLYVHLAKYPLQRWPPWNFVQAHGTQHELYLMEWVLRPIGKLFGGSHILHATMVPAHTPFQAKVFK